MNSYFSHRSARSRSAMHAAPRFRSAGLIVTFCAVAVTGTCKRIQAATVDGWNVHSMITFSVCASRKLLDGRNTQREGPPLDVMHRRPPWVGAPGQPPPGDRHPFDHGMPRVPARRRQKMTLKYRKVYIHVT